jgi:hypothetical protein
MLEYLEIDLQTGFRFSAPAMEAAGQTCRACKMFHTCDYQVESRYFICPNRELLDSLEDQQDRQNMLA